MWAVLNNSSGQVVGTINTNPKTFKTGSHGYVGMARLTDPTTSKQYLANLRLVELGTRPQPSKAKNNRPKNE